jgi:pyruvate ferredoxin oxidoreductase beta subunit
MANLKELAKKGERLSGGHRACAGCTFPQIIRQALSAVDGYVVVGAATGCMEVTTTIFPFSAWRVPFIHSAFENAAATMSGVEAAYKSLKRQGKYEKDVRFVTFGGDGGTYADTTTSPVGRASTGKKQFAKDLTAILVAHHVPYVAQASPSHWNDFVTKVQKALATDGPTFINVLMPCRLGWAFQPENAVKIARDAVNTCYWPLYEVENGQYRLTYKPKEKLPIVEFLKQQTKFRHLMKPGGEQMIGDIQAEVDARWKDLLKLCGQEA